jgi:hypothetical protein
LLTALQKRGPQQATAMSAAMKTDFNKLHACFMHRVCAPSVPALALKLAYLICFRYLNRESRAAFVSQETLARDLGATVRTVRRLADILESAGLTIAQGNGRGRASSYWIDEERATRASPFGPERGTPVSAFGPGKADIRDKKGGHFASKKADTRVRPTKKEEPRKNNQGSLKTLSPSDFSRDQKKKSDAKGLSGKTETETETKIKYDAFARFWQAYPRRVAKDAAKRAFAAAIKRGADAETLIAGARRYAIERQGQDHKYTKHPATWLNGGCWQDELNGTPVIDESGALVAIEQPQKRTGFRAIADAMIEESERGKLLGTHDERGWRIWGK